MDVHPKAKRPFGERLANMGIKSNLSLFFTPIGSIYKKAISKNNEVIIEFDYERGLHSSGRKSSYGF